MQPKADCLSDTLLAASTYNYVNRDVRHLRTAI